MKHEIELIRKQAAEERWSEDQTTDDLTDDSRLAEQVRGFASQARRDQNHEQLDQCKRHEPFRFVNRNGFRRRNDHLARNPAINIKIDSFRM